MAKPYTECKFGVGGEKNYRRYEERDSDDFRAMFAKSIAERLCLQPAAVYDWAVRHNADIATYAWIYVDPANDFLLDVLNDTNKTQVRAAAARVEVAVSSSGGGMAYGDSNFSMIAKNYGVTPEDLRDYTEAKE